MGRHRKLDTAAESLGFEKGTTGFAPKGVISDRIRAQSPEVQAGRDGYADRDSSNNDRNSNP